MAVADSLQALLQRAILFLPKLVSALVVFVGALVLSNLADRAVRRGVGRRLQRAESVHLIARPVRWAILVAGTLAALDQVDFAVTTFLAGLGVAGVTVGFALQDIARNFVAGIILLIRQPFRIGHAVSVAGYQGTLLDVNTRDITLCTWDGELVILPNLQVFQGPIVDYSAAKNRRRTIRLGLGYGQDVERAKAVFLAATSGVEGVLSDPAPMIHAEALGDYAINLALRFWLNHRTHSILEVHSNVVLALNRAAVAEGIEMPYPIQTVRMAQPQA